MSEIDTILPSVDGTVGVKVVGADISDDLFLSFVDGKVVALDIETTGLSWEHDDIATCQLYRPNGIAVIVRIQKERPPINLAKLIASQNVKKIFHHAVFDLRFMAAHWKCDIKNISCTKVASKILNDNPIGSHSLKDILNYHLGIGIPKGYARSDWFSHELSQNQLQYAVDDVIYLPSLLAALQSRLEEKARWDQALASFEYLPTRVKLDIQGIGDVFTY
ncbi:MAG: hypothetical protein B7X04_01505 [Parcubacteria group bacterium 21-54-25]|nr:MAG: hypothetical protein B7X04_01505 [Parcubacteria group bacterium 21-54-25]HQU07602.1 ribonuclease D [Candidatus Paceibacterota bacterium]